MTGGSSKVEGVIELAEEIFHLPVRLGVPKGVTGLTEVVCSPTNATGVGLLLFGHSRMHERGEETRTRGSFASILERMRSWFQGNF
jgi:cell division protein FtsA